MGARILIADDHEIIRRGVRAILEGQADWEICGEASSGRDAVQLARDLQPDLVIVAVSIAGLDGIEVTRQLKIVTEAPILILVGDRSDQLVAREAFHAGAHGYLVMRRSARKLVLAVQTLLARRLFVDEDRADADAMGGRGLASLTARERQILRLLVEGKSNKQVGEALGITTKTAETHRGRIMSKLGVHSIAELVLFTLRAEGPDFV